MNPQKLCANMTFRDSAAEELLNWAKADGIGHTTVATNLYNEGAAARRTREEAYRLGESQPSAAEATSRLGNRQVPLVERSPVDSRQIKISVGMTLRGESVAELLSWAKADGIGYTTVATNLYYEGAAARRARESRQLGADKPRLSGHQGESQFTASEATSRLGNGSVQGGEPSPSDRLAVSPAPDTAVPPPATPEPSPTSDPRRTEALVPAVPGPRPTASFDVDRREPPGSETLLGDHLGKVQVPHSLTTSRLGGRPFAVAAALTAVGLVIAVAIYHRPNTPVTPSVSAASPAPAPATHVATAAPTLPSVAPVAALAIADKDVEAVLSRIQTAPRILWVSNNPKDARITERLAQAKQRAPKMNVVIVTDDADAGQKLADQGNIVFVTAVRLDPISWLAIGDSLFVDASAKQGIVSISGKQARDQIWDWAGSILGPDAAPLTPRHGN